MESNKGVEAYPVAMLRLPVGESGGTSKPAPIGGAPVCISSELPEPKQRWAEGHEIGHTIIPWHGPISLGDDKYTLTANCHDAMEAEASGIMGTMLTAHSVVREPAGTLYDITPISAAVYLSR